MSLKFFIFFWFGFCWVMLLNPSTRDQLHIIVCPLDTVRIAIESTNFIFPQKWTARDWKTVMLGFCATRDVLSSLSLSSKSWARQGRPRPYHTAIVCGHTEWPCVPTASAFVRPNLRQYLYYTTTSKASTLNKQLAKLTGDCYTTALSTSMRWFRV